MAEGLILVELEGGQRSLFYNSLPFGLNFNRSVGGISGPIYPTALGTLVPRSGEDFLDRPLNALLLD